MTPDRRWALGDAVRVADRLEARDRDTRLRLIELMLGATPASEAPAPRDEAPAESVETAVEEAGPRRRRRDAYFRWIAGTFRKVIWKAMAAFLIAVAFSVLVQQHFTTVVVVFVLAAGTAVGLALALRSWIRRRPASVASQLIGREALTGVGSTGVPSQEVLDAAISPGNLPLDPLLLPRWTAGILATALAVETADGSLDIERIVDDMARLKVPTHLPRRGRRTLDRGAVVLVDISDGMLPLIFDVRELLGRLRRVVGPAVTVRRFDGQPLTAGTWPATSDTFELQTRRVVLALTNFGLFGPSVRAPAHEVEREWLELAARLRRARCPVVALVPLDPQRVPRSLRRRIAVLEWDRSTTIATAARAVGR